MTDFEKALAFTFRNEGGLSNHKADRGGMTNMGITKATLDGAYKYGLVSHNDIKKLTREEAEKIYEINYWNAGKCNLMRYPLNVIHFDTCVLHGKTGAAKILQRALTKYFGVHVNDDGIIGTKTIEKIDSIPRNALPEFTAKYYCMKRNLREIGIWTKNESQLAFKNGWANRTERCRQYALNKGKVE